MNEIFLKDTVFVFNCEKKVAEEFTVVEMACTYNDNVRITLENDHSDHQLCFVAADLGKKFFKTASECLAFYNKSSV